MTKPAVATRWVRQEEAHGCGIACIAMLAGWDYWRARAEFVAVYGETRARTLDGGGGITYPEIDAVLAERAGLAVARHWQGSRENRRKPWPVPPWAAAHLVQVVLPGGGHFVVLLRNGTVLDPATEAHRTLASYAEVSFIAAVAPVGVPAIYRQEAA
jgi:hypothetical protein